MAVAGCGPAGLAAALLLARDGHRVTIVERFAAPAPIGSGLMIQPTGLAVLRSLGLDGALIARSARIDRLSGQAGGRTVLDVAYATLGQAGLCGFGVHRATLFSVLHDAVTAAGIPVETGRTIAGSEPVAAGGRRLVFADGTRSAPFDLIVDALGTRTPLAPPCGRALHYGALWANLDAVPGFAGDALEQRYRRASMMAGVLPIGRPPGAAADQVAFFWSIRADRVAAWRQAGLAAWRDEVQALWPATAPLLEQIVDPDCLTFARYAHRTLSRPAGAAMIHIGDAWHSASPQLGQGANMALLDAYALAKGLREADGVAAGLAAAVALRRRHVRLYQALTALFTPVYQSDSRTLPFVRDRLVGPLSGTWPANRIQAAMVSGLIGSPLRPLALA
ncbi:FAD-dependent oxidoreductase [Sphingomonas sp. CLY1604]|uniref:FAD-dependent oxidoreductase n=1 Tax=Sphingomonas sp. CLY1604 TaxID=3457786 RepID=UPI003FD837FE